jgi:SRSO17 transposase
VVFAQFGVVVMTARRVCPPAAGPLEGYAAQFDELFVSLAQRRGFREYLTGLLLPRERNKTLTALAGAEPVVGAGAAAVQRLQFFVSESTWDAEAVNARRLELLAAEAATAAHAGGVLVVDDSGDRKAGHATAHVARQYLGSVGKTDNGIVAVSTLWADERVYYPLHVVPYTPAGRLPGGQDDLGFATKPQLAVDLVANAVAAGVRFAAVVGDCFYGPSETVTLVQALERAGLPYVLALKPHQGTWAPADAAHTPVEAAQDLGWRSRRRPGGWRPVTRRFRDGHTETWWAGDARLAGWGPDQPVRLVVATTNPATLPERSTWYVVTNRPHPDHQSPQSTLPAADLAEIVRCYGLRIWVEQGYKQVKHELGWADFQVRSTTAIRRHYTLVCCAFSFCWQAWMTDPPPTVNTPASAEKPRTDRRERGHYQQIHSGQTNANATLADRATPDPGLADPGHTAATLLARLVQQAPTTPTPRTPHHRDRRPPDPRLHPALTNQG